jgi:predicted nucleic acid-binding protein
MNVLLDTNVLARSAQPGHPHHQLAVDAVAALRAQGHALHLVPQNLYELWVLFTRPVSANGFGKSAADALDELNKLKGLFPVLPDAPAIYAAWEQLVSGHAVLGKNAHDARLVAAMQVHGLTALLTFNAGDFARFTGITVLTPAAVLAPPAPPGSP